MGTGSRKGFTKASISSERRSVMRSKLLTALAFSGLMMIAVPFTASAHDKASCGHRPGWGYTHPNWYNGWWQKNCSWRTGYNGNYYGNGWGALLPFGQGYGGQYYGRGYGPGYLNGEDDDDDGGGYAWNRGWDNDWNNGWNHRGWDHDGDGGWRHWDHDNGGWHGWKHGHGGGWHFNHGRH